MAYLKNEKLKETLLHKGVLHEVNRTFFHPLGLALTLLYFEESERMELKLQYTENEEGFVHEVIEKEKINSFRNYSNEKYELRNDNLGFVIQTQDVGEKEVVEKEYDIKKERLNIILKYLNSFIYQMHKGFLDKHKEWDKDNCFPYMEQIQVFMNIAIEDKDYRSVANYAMALAYYDELKKEISSLEMKEEENEPN